MILPLRFLFVLCLIWFCIHSVAAQSIPPSLHARIIQLEDERNLNGDELAKLLKHASPKVRERAALAIGRIGDKRGTAALLELLQSEKDESVRAMTAFALGEIEDVAAVPALLEFLTPGKYPIAVRARPVEALGKIASVLANIESLGKATLEQINARLIEQLPKPEFTLTEDKRLTAQLTITALMRVRSTASVEPLTQQLKSVEADNRALAANALARIRQPIASAVPALLTALNDNDYNVRANAARALGVSKDARAVEPLIKLLGDKSEQVQVSSIRALAAIGDKRAVEPLMVSGAKFDEQLSDLKSGSQNLLVEVISALHSLKDDRALQFLGRLRHPNGFGGLPELETAIARFGEMEFFRLPIDTLLLNRSDLGLVKNLVQGLGELQTEKSKELLLWLLGYYEKNTEPDEPSIVIPAILRALAKHKPTTLPFILRTYLVHRDEIVRATAANLIADTLNDQNFAALVGGWLYSEKDKPNDAKLAILSALAKYKTPQAIEAVKAGITDRDHLVRRHVVDLLKQMGDGYYFAAIGATDTDHDKLFYQRVVARTSKKVIATIHTNKGSVTMELFPADAPITVDSFITLARKGYFNGVTFHRVVPNFVIQGGDPRGTGNGGPGYQMRCEVNTRPYERGTLGMALSGKDTGGSQFFITHSPQPHLDGGYTVFGQVTKGMEVVDRIARGDAIKKIVVVER
ncbi:MAG: peptidylprolyl isomerase [Acidobacteriota bacterium]|nr:peptidylprolyl isomerase [Acidobacteriota bacterium]